MAARRWRATSVADTTMSRSGSACGSKKTSTSPRSWCRVRVSARPEASTSAAASTAAASNSAQPSVPCTSPPGTIDIRLPTAHGGVPITFTAVASTRGP